MEHSATEFVADFIGESNLFYGMVTKQKNQILNINLENGTILAKSKQVKENEIVYVSVRPENIRISFEPVEGFSLSGKVIEHVFVGQVTKTIISLSNGNQIKMNTFSNDKMIAENSKVYLYWEPEDAVVIKSRSDEVFNVIENMSFSQGD